MMMQKKLTLEFKCDEGVMASSYVADFLRQYAAMLDRGEGCEGVVGCVPVGKAVISYFMESAPS